MPAWLLWELAVLAASVRLAGSCGWRRDGGAAPEETLLGVVSIDVLIASSVATALSFAQQNSVTAYLCLAAVILAGSLAIRPQRALAFAESFADLIVCRHPFWFSALVVAFVPVLLLAFRPIQDVDSLNYLHYLLEWMKNRATPYQFFFNYVPLWESGFLPVLVLARSDLYFGLLTLKALAILLCALWLVSRELGLAEKLAAVVVANVAAFRYLWFEHSGVATLKNDTLYSAGAVLLALALVRAARGSAGNRDHLLLALGIVFVSIKSSGPILAMAGFVAYWVLRRPPWKWVLSSLGLAFAFSGHYYFHNLIQFGNPFYPYQINVAGVRLPGLAEISYTSILHNLHDIRLWRSFFLPSGGLSPAGLLFPAVLVASLFYGTILSGLAVVRWLRNRETPRPEAWLAGLTLLGWLIYFRSFYSAGSASGNLGYLLNDLVSLRYVSGIIGMSEILLASLLLRRFGIVVPLILALIQLASRLWLLYRLLPLDVFPVRTAVLACTGVACALLLVSSIRRPRLRTAITAGTVLLTLLVAAPRLTERNRIHWVDWWKPVLEPLRGAPASSVFLVEDARAGEKAGHFVLAGDRLQHDVKVGNEASAGVARTRYVVKLISPGEPRPDFGAFAASLAPRGYVQVLTDQLGVVLERASAVSCTEPVSAWLLASNQIPAVGTPADRGGAVPGSHALGPGEFAMTQSGHLFQVSALENKLALPGEKNRVLLKNTGEQARGLSYIYESRHWTPDVTALPRLNPDPHFQQAARDRSLGNRFVSVSSGAYRVEYLNEKGGGFLRIHALNDTQWLVVVSGSPTLPDGRPLTLRTQIRCPLPGGCWFTVVGAQNLERSLPAGGRWATLDLMLRWKGGPGGHIAAGRRQSKAGDYFDIRELSMIEGFVPSRIPQ